MRRSRTMAMILLAAFVGVVCPVLSQGNRRTLPKSTRRGWQESWIGGSNNVVVIYAECNGDHDDHDSFMATNLNTFRLKYPKAKFVFAPYGSHDFTKPKCGRLVGYTLLVVNPGDFQAPPDDSTKGEKPATSKLAIPSAKVASRLQ